jgi:hypothetical protein
MSDTPIAEKARAALNQEAEAAETVEDVEEAAEAVEATYVPPGASYPQSHNVQRFQSVTTASSLNSGSNAVDYEDEARGVARPANDGVHIEGGKKVYYKTFRIGIPAGAGLPADNHESNMRQTVEDVLKAGERADSRVRLHSVEDDELSNHVLMTYVVDLA